MSAINTAGGRRHHRHTPDTPPGRNLAAKAETNDMLVRRPGPHSLGLIFHVKSGVILSLWHRGVMNIHRDGDWVLYTPAVVSCAYRRRPGVGRT